MRSSRTGISLNQGRSANLGLVRPGRAQGDRAHMELPRQALSPVAGLDQLAPPSGLAQRGQGAPPALVASSSGQSVPSSPPGRENAGTPLSSQGRGRPGTSLVAPRGTRPRCKVPGCPNPWTGSYLLLCDFHEEQHFDFWNDARREETDGRESDRGLVL